MIIKGKYSNYVKSPHQSKQAKYRKAAMEGEGVALASPTMVKADLDSGRLVQPFDTDVTVDRSYYVVCAPERLVDPDVGAVLEWLI